MLFLTSGSKSRNSLAAEVALDKDDEEDRREKPILVIPFDINAESAIGLLSEHKVVC